MLRRLWPVLSILTLSGIAFGNTNSGIVRHAALTEPVRTASAKLQRTAEFAGVEHVSSKPGCVDVQLPQALATPDPVIASVAARKVKVSFIIGTDGRVYSPLILESGGTSSDRQVLETVGRWRYRPATCNGAPTEIEGKVEFSRR